MNFKSKQPCQEMATWPFLKGSFLAKSLFFSNETNENEMFVNAFHRPRLLCELSVIRGNNKRGEQRKHQNGEGRKTIERWRKNSAPDHSQKERGESRSWIPEQFRITWANCSARVRKVTPRPSAAISIRKNIAFKVFFSQHVCHSTLLYTPIFSFGRPALDQKQFARIATLIKNSHQGALLFPSKSTKMHIIASDFQKFLGGACPRTTLAGLGLRPSFSRLICTQVEWCLEISLNW